MESLEFVSTLRREYPKASITVIDDNRESRVQSQYGKEVAKSICKYSTVTRIHQNRGVQFHLGRKIQDMTGSGGVIKSINMTGKTVETDLVIYFPNNVSANNEMFEGSYLLDELQFDKTGKILTGIDLNTGSKRMFAAGDCSAVPSFANSERFKNCSYAESIIQGMVAGINLNAMGIPYAYVPYREYDFYGHKFREIGIMNYHELIVTEGDLNSFDYMAYYVNKGIGVMKAAGFPKKAKDMQVLRECIRTNIPIGGDPESTSIFSQVNVDKLEKNIRVVPGN